MQRSLSALLTGLALASASCLAPMAYAAETPPPASDTAPGQSADPGGTVTPDSPMHNKSTMHKRTLRNTPPPASDMAPGHTSADGMPIPMEPTAAGMNSSAKPEPHAQVVRDAKAQYRHDKETCRESTMSKQEFRDCTKAAKMERNEKINDSPAQIPVKP